MTLLNKLTRKIFNKNNKQTNDEIYDYDNLKFIWGVIAQDDLSDSKKATLNTLNDIDITYNTNSKKYSIDIETIYRFKSHKDECLYLRNLLKSFTEYMNRQGFSASYTCDLSCLYNLTNADSIEELYTKFRIFVNGFCNDSLYR